MKSWLRLWAIFTPLLFTASAWAEFEKEFGNHTGTFVLLDGQKNTCIAHNKQRAKQAFSPCSTFKIPSTLIALETKTLSSPEQKIKWDKEKYPEKTLFLKEWAQDMDLKKAFKFSCVWFYKEVATKVGMEQMNHYLKEFNYGNKDTSGGLTQFWLTSSLKISAMDQALFLRDLHQRKFKLSKETYDTAENEIFIEEKTPTYTLRSKTGTGPYKKDTIIAWYVGYVTKGDKVWYFALNMDAKDMKTDHRKTIARAILKKQGIID